MQQFMNDLYNLVTSWGPLVYLLVAVVLFIVGIMFIIPSQKTKEMAITAIPFILIGCGIVLGATSLATEVSSAFVF